jgi:hypothetical protein
VTVDRRNAGFVELVQAWLIAEGHPLAVDGDAGPRTRAAFVDETGFDGADAPDAPPAGWPRPRAAELTAFYGAPGKGIVTVPLPYPMRLAWDPTTTVTRTQCHHRVTTSLQGILESVRDHYGSIGALRDARMDLLGGVFNLRRMRGGSSWSLHAYGAAIDLDPTNNGLTTPWPAQATMPLAVVQIFERAGWTSLARVIGRDAMHFQATTWP